MIRHLVLKYVLILKIIKNYKKKLIKLFWKQNYKGNKLQLQKIQMVLMFLWKNVKIFKGKENISISYINLKDINTIDLGKFIDLLFVFIILTQIMIKNFWLFL